MNKVRYGLKNTHYSVIEEIDGNITFGTPVPLKGALALNLSATGDKLEIYADDGLYYSEANNQGYEGDFEVVLLDDLFKKNVLGYEEDANGVLFENSSNKIKKIALLFEFSGDAHKTRRVLYNVTLSRPNVESGSKTKSIDVKYDKLSITAAPHPINGNVQGKATPTQATQYDAWFDSVYEYVPVV